VLFNSGSSANLAILQSLKNLGILRVGDLIGFSAVTWSTNTMPIIQMGMVPVAIDCDPKTLNVMSWHLLDRLKKMKLQALFITNALGWAGDLDVIRDICNTNKIILLEDNCEALGTELFSGKTGNFGLASSFSFFVAHHMSTIEGGMACTNDATLAEMLRIVRANGWDRNLNAEQQYKWRKRFGIRSEFNAKYTFYDLAYNMRPTEITGFLGLFQLQFLNKNIEKRESNYKIVEEVIVKNQDLLCPECSHIKKLSCFVIPVVCKTSKLRNIYMTQFSGAGVEIRPLIAGNMQRQPFHIKYVKEKYDLPGADFLHDCSFYCGNYPELTETDLNILCSCLMKI
jgi:CDP-6-deoxy-D-xylo-4-hexulose-3-dehydrase